MSEPLANTPSNHTSPATKQESDPRKSSKPAFDEFLKSLRDAIEASAKKDVLPKIILTLKKGFAGDLRPDHVDAVVNALAQYRSLDRLGVRLIPDGSSKGGRLLVAVRNRLRSRFADDVAFPQPQGSTAQDADRWSVLMEWIKAGDARRPRPDLPQYPEEWSRKAFVCLASEPDEGLRLGGVNRLLHIIARRSMRGGKAFHSDSLGFVREASKLVSAAKISIARVASSLQFAHPLEHECQEGRRTASDALQQKEEAVARLTRAQAENDQLNGQLTDALAQNRELQRRLAEVESQLQRERNRSGELEKHWEHESQQLLARQRHLVCSNILHDLQEARLSLDRETPNITMALNRIRQMEDSLRKLENSP